MKKFSILLLVFFINGSLFSQVDNCIHLDGNDDYIYVGDVVDLGFSDFTLEAWIYIDQMGWNGGKVISKGLTSVGTPSNAGYGLRVGKTGPNELEFHLGDSSGATIRVLYDSITLNTWHHIAGVRSGREVILYLNGLIVASNTTTEIYNVDTDMPLSIGAIDKGGFSATNEFFTGRIDEVRIWDRALSALDIIQNMNCAITSPNPNLKAVYNLNESVGISASDSSGNANHGSLSGVSIPWFSSSVAPICPTSIENQHNLRNSYLYPNPSSDKIFISNLPLEDVVQYSLFDYTGKLVRSDMLHDGTINLIDLSKGTYVIHLESQNWRKLFPVIKL